MCSLIQAERYRTSATDACAVEGRAGDAFDMGCPTQVVQSQKTYRPLWVISGHVQCNLACPLCANSGLMRCNMIGTKKKDHRRGGLSEIQSGILIRPREQQLPSVSCASRAHLVRRDRWRKAGERPGGVSRKRSRSRMILLRTQKLENRQPPLKVGGRIR